MANAVSTDAGRPERETDRVRVSRPLRKSFGLLRNLQRSRSGFAPRRSGLCRFEGHRARDPVRLAGTQRKQEVTTLKIRSANQIDSPQTGCDGGTNIDAKESDFRDLTGIALDEVQPAHTNLQSS